MPERTGNAAEDRGNLAAWNEACDELAREWGCPAAGHKPPAQLPEHLAGELAHVETLTGAEPAGTCPFACLARDPWLDEIAGAVSLVVDWHVPITETIGRPLTVRDIEALKTLKAAQGAAWKSDRDLDEADRKRREADARRGVR